MKVTFALCLAALLSLNASAHPGYKIQLTAQFKETKKGQANFRNVFITGHAHYPDGTVLKVGVRNEKVGGSYLFWVNAPVRGQEFAAEMGPWNQSFPPGKYICEAWFEFEKQPEAVRNSLKDLEEFQECLKDNPDYQERYKKENPEKYEKLMKQIAASGKCASNKAFGACELMIGSADEAEQADENERAFIRGTADGVKELIKALVDQQERHLDQNKSSTVNAEAYQAWLTEWQEAVSSTDLAIAERRKGVVVTAYGPIYSNLSDSLKFLFDYERNLQATLYGDVAAKSTELETLNGKGEGVNKDEKRRRENLRKELAGVLRERTDLQEQILVALADALYGSQGLDPAPERRKVTIEEWKTEFGFEFESK